MHRPIHVVHVVHRFAPGGMENVFVQLINGLPHDDFRHTIVALTQADPVFLRRIERSDVEIIALDKQPGQPYRIYPRFFALLKRLRADVFHSGNLAALDMTPVAAAAAIPRRVHAEHGWDVHDPEGRNWKYILVRKAYRRFVHDYVTVSKQLYTYVRHRVGVEDSRVHLIPNGVDTMRFHPRMASDIEQPNDYPFQRRDHLVVGTVGRLEPIKNQRLLLDAFAAVLRSAPADSERLRLALVGSGPLTEALKRHAVNVGISERVWWAGTRDDVPEILRAFDVFVLPSLAEGTSCTLQEAMATGLPIIATHVGGNSDLLGEGAFGTLVPSGDVTTLANAIRGTLSSLPASSKGPSAREEVVRRYSLTQMIERYRVLFSRSANAPATAHDTDCSVGPTPLS
ncbi:MAG: TIGR03088 family PEP-CTERM/XrtA system glycosyltransferase [Deltaproteobacteria bacterium]|nr:TIGR03088 family PEP-CTERM/XrtA system glycosyltransferase [Deltaproteobacteria bacterium]